MGSNDTTLTASSLLCSSTENVYTHTSADSLLVCADCLSVLFKAGQVSTHLMLDDVARVRPTRGPAGAEHIGIPGAARRLPSQSGR